MSPSPVAGVSLWRYDVGVYPVDLLKPWLQRLDVVHVS